MNKIIFLSALITIIAFAFTGCTNEIDTSANPEETVIEEPSEDNLDSNTKDSESEVTTPVLEIITAEEAKKNDGWTKSFRSIRCQNRRGIQHWSH